MQIIRDGCYRASVDLAIEKGPFPLYDELMLESEFAKTLPKDLREDIRRNGIRNSHLLSVAPTGTISLSADNVSSGIEPVFSHYYDRIIQTFDGPREERVEDYAYRQGVAGRTANAITADEHLNVLILASKYVDSAVSKTCNVGDDVTFDEFKQLYYKAWKGGCSGITTFRASGKRYGILNEVKTEDMILPRTPQDKDIAKRRGTQPAKYHKGLAPSTKAKRDAQFKRQSKMRDDDPKAYKPAPGDATAKTKPSKYTKMYHDTYGEGVEMEYSDFFKLIDKIEEEISPALKARQEREKKQLAIRHTRQQSRAKIRNIRSEDINSAFGEMISEKSQSALAKKSEKSGISVGTLRKVYNRGVAAWKTGHRPGTTPQQWGYARVNAFIAKKKKGNLNHDKDLA